MENLVNCLKIERFKRTFMTTQILVTQSLNRRQFDSYLKIYTIHLGIKPMSLLSSNSATHEDSTFRINAK